MSKKPHPLFFEAFVENVVPQELLVVVEGVAAPEVSQTLQVFLGRLVREVLLLTQEPLLVLSLFSPRDKNPHN